MTKFSAHLAISVAIFAIAYWIVTSIPALNQMNISIEKWGWAVIIAIGVLVMALQNMITFFCVALTRNTRWEMSPPFGAFLNRTADYICYAITLVTSAALAPGLVSYTSAAAVFGLALVIGLAASTAFWLGERFDMYHQTRKEMALTRNNAYEIGCFIFSAIVVLWLLYVVVTVAIAWIW